MGARKGPLLDITTNRHHFYIFPISRVPYTNARLKKYPLKAVLQVASRDIFPIGEAEPRGYSVSAKGKAKNPERAQAESRRRAAAAVRDIALCNQFSHMFTWTIDPNLVDRHSPEEVYQKVRIFLSNAVQRYGFSYIAIPEYHKPDEQGQREVRRALSPKGKPITDKQGRPVYNMTNWKWGFSTCVPLDGHYEQAVNYVVKYIAKGEEKIFGKWYLSSRGLKKGPDIFPLESVSYPDFRDEEKLKVHLQSEIEIYPTVHLISEELPPMEDIENNE